MRANESRTEVPAIWSTKRIFASNRASNKVASNILTVASNILASVIFASGILCSACLPIRAHAADTGPLALKVVGTNVVNSKRQVVRLRGVNTASMEWSSNGEGHILDTIKTAIQDWHANIIRLPLSQDRWFGKAPDQKDDGSAYRDLVKQIVDYCDAQTCYILLDLHWSDAGAWGQQIGQHLMPDANSVLFWQDCAKTYKNRSCVLFDLYNEPHDISWDVWQKGGDVTENDRQRGYTKTYTAVGMQALLDTVRGTGAKNVVVAGGLDWAYDMSGFLDGKQLSDPKGNGVIYANHDYPFKGDTFDKWLAKMETASKQIPIIVSEFGSGGGRRNQGGAGDQWILQVMQALKDHNWNWIAWDLHPAAGPTLVSDWNYTPTPNFGVYVKEALAGKLPTYTPPAPAKPAADTSAAPTVKLIKAEPINQNPVNSKLINLELITGSRLGSVEADVRDPASQALAKDWLARWEKNIIGESGNRYCDKETGEEIGWLVSPCVDGFYYGYLATRDTKWIDMLIDWSDSWIKRGTKEPDGYMGWPKDDGTSTGVVPGLYTDNELGDAMGLTPAVRMAYVILKNTALERKYGDKARAYIKLSEQMFKKWDSRGAWREVKEGGVWVVPEFGIDKATGQWTDGYAHRAATGFSLPDNKQNFIALWMLAMYDATKNPVYRTRAEKWFSVMKSRMKLREDGKYYVWDYWDPAGPWDYKPNGETRHWVGVHPNGGYYGADLEGITAGYEHGLVFTRAEIDKLIATNRDYMWNHQVQGAKFQRIDGGEPSDPWKNTPGVLWTALVPYDANLRKAFEANHNPGSWSGLSITPWYIAKMSGALTASNTRVYLGVRGEH